MFFWIHLFSKWPAPERISQFVPLVVFKSFTHLFAETTLSACCIQVLYYDKLPSNPWYQWYLPITFTLLPCHSQRRGELSRREAFNLCMTQLFRGEVPQKFQGVFSHQWMLQVWDGFVFVPPCQSMDGNNVVGEFLFDFRANKLLLLCLCLHKFEQKFTSGKMKKTRPFGPKF